MESNEIDLDSVDNSKSGLEKFLYSNKLALSLILLGISMIGFGIFYLKNGFVFSSNKVEIIPEEATLNPSDDVIVEISGSVFKPGVYKLNKDARVNEAINVAGGLTSEADKIWVERSINLAAKLTDGQKIYIPRTDERSNVLSANNDGGDLTASGGDVADNSLRVNINTSSASQLDQLPGIGPVYAQNIIEHRPYSSIEELLSRGVLKKNVYEKIKDKVSVY